MFKNRPNNIETCTHQYVILSIRWQHSQLQHVLHELSRSSSC